jgi:hypothetical protein
MRRLASTVVLALLGIGVCSAAGAGGRWTTKHPLHQPVTLTLPSSWSTSPPGRGTEFYAESPADGANVSLWVSPFPTRAHDFVAYESPRTVQYYRTQARKAKVQAQTVQLPAGQAVEVIATFSRKTGGHVYAIVVHDYALLHGGQIYEFAYWGAQSRSAVDLPVADRSAQSIRFTS